MNENDEKEQVRKCHAVAPKVTIELDDEMQIIFNQLKKIYAKDLSNKEAMKTILRNMKKFSEDVPGNGIFKFKTAEGSQKRDVQEKKQSKEIVLPSRHIPAIKKREIFAKTQGKCAYPGCTGPIEHYHHAVPFAFNRSHKSIIGLCKIHHEFCHNGVVRNGLREPGKSIFDSFYLGHKARS